MPSPIPFSALPVLEPFIERGELAGAVTLVANSQEILSLESCGFADIETSQPMTTDATFWIASQTKSVTGTALMMLVDEGLVDIEEPIEKYLPEFAGQLVITEQDENHRLLQRPIHPITVRNILTHTGGLPFLTPVEQPYIDVLSLREASKLYALLPLLTEPDTVYLYSNVGTNLVGRIIEVISGEPYAEFLQRRLFDPLGMTDTTFWPNREQVARLASAYKPDETNTRLEKTSLFFLQHPLDSPSRHPMPGGGLFSTATDVARFCQMILRGGETGEKRYLSLASVQEMTKRQTISEHEGYGFCWAVSGDSFGHNGAYSTNMTIDVKRDLITVFLAQHAGFPGEGAQCRDAFRAAAIDYYENA